MTDDQAGRDPGTVCGTGGGLYRIRLDGGTQVDAMLRGRLKRERRTGGKVVIGDRVSVAPAGSEWVVEDVEPRRSEIARRGPGGRSVKVVAANLDFLFVVVAAADPDPTLALVDRLLVIGEASSLPTRLVLNKVDLDGDGTTVRLFRATYEPIGYELLPVSAATGEGLEVLRDRVCRGTSALVGPSGAGKSSLLNALDPTLDLRIGSLSRKRRRGRHTTVSSRLIPLSCGGWVADTPGFSDVGLWGVARARVGDCFPDFNPHVGRCRFRGCAHVEEPDCAVLEAVARGAIAETRYRSYVSLREEASG
jgi:ribosome biogenesis GTPase